MAAYILTVCLQMAIERMTVYIVSILAIEAIISITRRPHLLYPVVRQVVCELLDLVLFSEHVGEHQPFLGLTSVLLGRYLNGTVEDTSLKSQRKLNYVRLFGSKVQRS